ncbi:PucR family transcriptional regulator [Mycolicibacterium septicum]|uniref:PucR family transcriptional regulator n=1 Tax=Mycolicibacterium septicum TaxID=98668 RepID=UPI00235F326D|nr:PucR family transcriptional regulator [Mycolicibacterium septicum]
MTAKPDRRVEEALRAIVDRFADDYAASVHDMEALVGHEVPEIAENPALRQLFIQGYADHGRTIRAFFQSDPSDDLDQAIPGATQFARESAYWGIPAATVIQLFQVGAELIWSWWTDRIAQVLIDPEIRTAVSMSCTRIIMSRMNNAVKLIAVAHAAEHAQHTYGVSWKQRETIMRILTHAEIKSTRELSREFGYEFDGWHVALIFWGTDDSSIDLSSLAAVAQSWIGSAVGKVPLLVPVDDGSMWSWFSTPTPMSIDADVALPRAGVRVAVGEPGVGLDGFRGSHEEARHTRDLVDLLDTDEIVFRHSDLAALALLKSDSALLARFVHRTLGELAAPSSRAQRLRETVRSYLAHGENVRAAAAAMHFHRNTVQTRLDLAAQLRGRPLDQDRLELALAIEIAEKVGGSVLPRLPKGIVDIGNSQSR